jgi:hypothetical protein
MVQYLKCTIGYGETFIPSTNTSQLCNGYIKEVPAYVGTEDGFDQVRKGESS